MEISFVIGGAVSSSLLAAAGEANKSFSRLGRTGDELRNKLAAIEKIEYNQQKIQSLSGKLREAQAKAQNLHREFLDGSPRSAEEQEKLALSAALPLEGNRERAGGMRQGGHKGGSFIWKDVDGIYREIGDADAFRAFVTAALLYGQSQYAREEMLQKLVETKTTVEDMLTVTWMTVPPGG